MAYVRRYTFKLYPTGPQLAALEDQRQLHCDLYNGLVQQRIEAYQRQGKTLTYFDQCKEITELRAELPEYAALSRNSLEATAQRVDRAFQAFFRRAKQGMGAQSGFPRFRGWRFFPGFSFKKPGSGWNIELKEKDGRPRNGRLYIKGVPGKVRLRGRLPCQPESIKTCDLCWHENRWWLSLVVVMPTRRQSGAGTGEVHFDLIDSFAVVRPLNGPRGAGPERIYAWRDGRIR